MEEKRELNMEEMDRISGGDEKPKKWVDYHVVEGDTLLGISKRYMCAVPDLKRWNNLTSDALYPWMTLKIYTINY